MKGRSTQRSLLRSLHAACRFLRRVLPQDPGLWRVEAYRCDDADYIISAWAAT